MDAFEIKKIFMNIDVKISVMQSKYRNRSHIYLLDGHKRRILNTESYKNEILIP